MPVLGELLPEGVVLLGQGEFVRGNDALNPLTKAGFFQLDIEAALMGIGDQPNIPAAALQGIQKSFCAGVHANQVANFAFERGDVES